MRPRHALISRIVASWLLLAGIAFAAPAPVTGVNTSGNQLNTLTVNGLTYPQAQLAPGSLTVFAGGSAGVVLVPNGTAAPASGTRAGLVGDWLLDSGIINPLAGQTTCRVRFSQPIVNRPNKPDIVFMEINPGSIADAMQVTINGVNRVVTGGEWGSVGYATASADQYSTGTTATTLAALEGATLALANADISQAVFGVAIDLADFGIAPNGTVEEIDFGSSGATFDPVFIAGFTGDGVPPAGAVSLPYVEPFTTGAGSFTPANPAEWSVTGGAYRNTIAGSSSASSAHILTNDLGGDPLAAHGFFLSGKFTVVSSGNSGNVVGLALFGTNATFTGGVTFPYYLIEVRPAGNTLRVRRVGVNDTQFLPETALGAFTLNAAQGFTLEIVGGYENGVLRMAVTVRQGASSATFHVVDSEPLTVGYFGFRNRTNGGALTVDCDDFTLRHVSTITFGGAPAAFARAGLPYSSDVSAASDVGAAVTLTAPELPGWLAFTPGASGTGVLSGTPFETGSYPLNLAATDSEGGAAEKTFHISVLEPTGVFISEFLAENDSGLRDEDGDQEDWIEVFNSDATPADVGGWGLSNDPALPMKWMIPAGVTIPAHGFLVVFASGKNRAGAQLHANFKLSNNAGSHLSLAQPGGAVVSSFASYPSQRADRSYGTYASYTPRGYLVNPTPGAPNDAVGYAGFVADTQFSVRRGFYTTAQSVTVTCATPGATLVYTTNGSTPSLTNGTQGTSPLVLNIPATTTLRVSAFAPNLIPSGPDTQSYFFLEDIRQQPTSAPAGWPAGSVNGQVLQYGMDPDITGSVTAQQMKDALAALPTLSLVTDLPNLFDKKNGIYVNPYGREEGFECPVSVELLNPNNTPGFHVNAGLRIRGGFSRQATNPKHNFHLYFRGEYGATTLQYPLFGDEGVDEFDRVDLRSTQVMSWHNGGDTNATYNRDEWNRATHGAMGQPYTRGRYYHLYINGHYWGIYGTQERADSAFASSYFGGKRSDYDVMKTYVIPHRVDAADGDNVAWSQLHAAATAGFASDAAYFAVQGRDANGVPNATTPLVDVDNLIDYTALHFYNGDDDAPVNTGVGGGVPKNFYAIRARDGRFGFQFYTHDAEGTMVTGRNTTGTITAGQTLAYFNPRWLSQQFETNAKYRLRFADRVQKHFFNGGAVDNPVALARWQAIRAQLSTAILAESARWGDAASATPRTVANWNTANDTIETGFLATRRAVLISQLRSRSLFPSFDAPAFSQHGGNVASGYQLNITAPGGTTIFYTTNGTDPTDASSNSYSGPIALTGVQVTVKARAKLGSEWSALTEALFTIDAVPAAPGNLAISEIHYNPAGSDETEFVELVNISASRVNLAGVHFTSAMSFTFGNLALEPGARICVVESTDAFAAAYIPTPSVAGQWSGALNNGGDTIVLLAANGTEIERVTYGDAAPWPPSANGGGYSLVRLNPSAAANTAANWRASTVQSGNPGSTDASIFTGNPLADADSDGIKALAEHFFATSDNNAASGHGAVFVGRTPDGRAMLTFLRRLGTDDLTYVVEVSGNLTTWTTDTTRTAETNHGNGTATETWTANQPAEPQFMRVRVTKP